MTREEHLRLWEEHSEIAMKLLRESYTGERFDWAKYTEYLMEQKIANRHYGTASAMYTKEMNKKYSMLKYWL